MRESLADDQTELATALPEIEAWVSRGRESLKIGSPLPLPLPLPPTWPDFPFGETRFRPRCVTLHNGMIAWLIPTALRSALWYQEENNPGGPIDCELYIAKKRAMLND